MNKFLITGMFRSGTTLLARMLNTHRDIVCASDPFRPFFNYFRDDVAQELGIEVDPYDPLGSYFADEEQLKLFKEIQDLTLDRSFPSEEKDRLLDKVHSHGNPFSPKIIDNLTDINGSTFKEVYDDLLSYVPCYYGQGNEQWQATKEVWSTEFVSVLAKTYPEDKFIVVVRDPRAVAASKNVKDAKYPWLFLIRQWRKLAILAWVYSNYASFKERVLLLKYEDLVEFPEDSAQKICDFLDICLDQRMLNPANFVDGKGEKWLQNSSYQNKKASFNTDSVDKWKDILDEKVIKYIEQLCFAEMKLFEYKFYSSDKIELGNELLLNPPFIKVEDMADWIKEYYQDRTLTSHLAEVGKEKIRQEFILASDKVLDKQMEKVLETYFLDIEFFNESKNLIRNG